MVGDGESWKVEVDENKCQRKSKGELRYLFIEVEGKGAAKSRGVVGKKKKKEALVWPGWNKPARVSGEQGGVYVPIGG